MPTIVISGASGFVGRALSEQLCSRGARVLALVRPSASEKDGIRWDPEAQTIDANALEGVDAVVHLAGESIASGRWNDAKKRRLVESRVRGTELIARTLASLERKPSVWVSASAVGYYGDRGDAWLDEDSTPGDDFLAELALRWEACTKPAELAGIRVVHARLGIVLDPSGGALEKMLLPFRLGVGGRIGDGKQFMSWISRRDAVRALEAAIDDPALRGPVNLTAPEPVTNAELTRLLGRALGRPALLPVPAFAARLAFGEMADVALLSGARVRPKRLLESGFHFDDPDLAAYLAAALG
jgi:uncharacterized protein (TIGR01777 family)